MKTKHLMLMKTCLSFTLALSVFVSGAVQGQTVADPAAPVGFKPTVTTAPNGTPMVLITAPSAGGISKNLFQDYNVDASGLIINNSTVGGASVLGGVLSANPNFSGSAATLILNQVTGPNPSMLLGPTEIFGSRAKLVIANPNGMTVDGASFINTSRLTLTTGTPTLNLGQDDLTLTINNTAGITIGSGGLNNGGDVSRNLSQVDLISRTVSIGGEVKDTDNLNILAGQRTYTHSTENSTGTGGSAPAGTTYAIDAAALGAAKAGQIHVISSDQGVGVRMRGDMAASASHITISADGNILFGKATTAQDFSVISANGSVVHSGSDSTVGRNLDVQGQHLTTTAGSKITTTGNSTITLGGVMDHSGTLKGSGNITISANEIQLNAGSGVDSGDKITATSATTLKANGTLSGVNDTKLLAGDRITVGGVIRSKSGGTANVELEGKGITVSGTVEAGKNLNVKGNQDVSITSGGHLDGGNDQTINSDTLVNRGQITAGRKLTINPVSGMDNNQGGYVSAPQTQISGGGQLSNRQGLIQVGANGLNVAMDSIDNVGGYIQGNGAVAVEAKSGGLNNDQGLIQTTSTLNLKSHGIFSNQEGSVLSYDNFSIEAPTVDNTVGSIQSLADGRITTAYLINARRPTNRSYSGEMNFDDVETSEQATLSADGNLIITLESATGLKDGTMLNRASTISAGHDLVITGGSGSALADILQHQRWHQEKYKKHWYSSSKVRWVMDSDTTTETPGYLYGGNSINLDFSGTFNNTGTIQTPALNIAAASIVNGIDGHWLHTPPPTVPANRISPGLSTSLPDPVNPLYKVTHDPSSAYLITSSAPLPDGILTKDDVLNRLGLAGEVKAKFFADPLYEAKLLHELTQKETGKNYLTDAWTTDREQRQKLIESMISYALAHPEARFGVALTDAQIQVLTAPMVWYVTEKDPVNGQDVLMPQIYLPDASLIDLKKFNGGQIMADNAAISTSGKVRNTGYMIVKDDLTINAGDVENEKRTVTEYASYRSKGLFGSSKINTVALQVATDGGEITAGNLTINTPGSFHNLGGSILADQRLKINAGGDIVNQAQKSEFLVTWKPGFWGTLAGKGSAAVGTTFLPGQILSGDTIDLQSGNAVQNVGSKILAVGDIDIHAKDFIKQDIQSATYTTYESSTFGLLGFKDKQRQQIVTQRAETTSQNGNVNFNTVEGDITSRGSTIAAGQDINLTAQKGSVIFDSATTYGVNKDSKSDLFSPMTLLKSTSASASEWNTAKTELPVVAAGRDLNIQSGKNIEGTGLMGTVGRDATLTAGGDVSFKEAKEHLYLHTEDANFGITFFGSEVIKAAMTGGDVGQAVIDTVPMGSSIQSLSKSRSFQDFAFNGTSFGLDAFNTLSAFSSGVNAPGGGLGEGLMNAAGVRTVGIEFGMNSAQQEWTKSYLTDFEVGRDLTIRANQDILLKGGTQLIAGNNMTLDAGRDLTIEANKDEFSSNSSGWGGSLALTFGGQSGGVGLTLGVNHSWSDALGNTYTAGGLLAGGALTTRSGNDTAIRGGGIQGDTVQMDVGGNLSIASVQDTFKSESGNWAGSITLTPSGGVTGSFSYNQAKEDSAWVNQMSGIQSIHGATINVAKDMHLKGASINDESGNLAIHSDTFSSEDIQNHSKSSSFGISVSGSPVSGKPSNGGSQGNPILGTVGFQMAKAEKEGVTRATVGNGTIQTIQNSDLTQLNRDLEKAQEVTKDTHSEIKVLVPIPNPDGKVWKDQFNSIGQAFHKLSSDPQLPPSVRQGAKNMEKQVAEVDQTKDPQLKAQKLEALGDPDVQYSLSKDSSIGMIDEYWEATHHTPDTAEVAEVYRKVMSNETPYIEGGSLKWSDDYASLVTEIRRGLEPKIQITVSDSNASDNQSVVQNQIKDLKGRISHGASGTWDTESNPGPLASFAQNVIQDTVTKIQYDYEGGDAAKLFTSLGKSLFNIGDNSTNPWLTKLTYVGGGSMDAVAGMLTPKTYVDALQQYGQNVKKVYQTRGLGDAAGYALTTWNVQPIFEGIFNIDGVTGLPVGDGLDRVTRSTIGVLNTAGFVLPLEGPLSKALSTPSSRTVLANAQLSSMLAMADESMASLAMRTLSGEATGSSMAKGFAAYDASAFDLSSLNGLMEQKNLTIPYGGSLLETKIGGFSKAGSKTTRPTTSVMEQMPVSGGNGYVYTPLKSTAGVSELFGANDLVIGSKGNLEFLKQRGGIQIPEFGGAEVGYGKHLESQMTKAEKIRISMDGPDGPVVLSDITRKSGILDKYGNPKNGVTEFGIYKALTTPELFAKSEFYLHNTPVPKDWLLIQLEQNGFETGALRAKTTPHVAATPPVNLNPQGVVGGAPTTASSSMELSQLGKAGEGKMPNLSNGMKSGGAVPEIKGLRDQVMGALVDDLMVKSGKAQKASLFGVQIEGRLADAQMQALTKEYGVEFAQIYRPGRGKNGGGGTYWLYAGSENHVTVPVANDVIVVNHTHLSGEASQLASPADYRTLKNLADSGSPQRSSQIVVVGDEKTVRFHTSDQVSRNPAVKPASPEFVKIAEKAAKKLKNNGVVGFGYNVETQELMLFNELSLGKGGSNPSFQDGIIFGNINREGVIHESLSHSGTATKADIREATRAVQRALDPTKAKWEPQTTVSNSKISSLGQSVSEPSPDVTGEGKMFERDDLGAIVNPATSKEVKLPVDAPKISATSEEVKLLSIRPPGEIGRTVSGKITPAQMDELSAGSSTYYSLVYFEGPGKNGAGGAFRVYSGDRAAPIPLGDDVHVVYKTEPNTAVSSAGKMDVSGSRIAETKEPVMTQARVINEAPAVAPVKPFEAPTVSASAVEVKLLSVRPPGEVGRTVSGKLTPAQLEELSAENNAHYALVYFEGPGKNGAGGSYRVYSGERSAPIPVGEDVHVVYKASPGKAASNASPSIEKTQAVSQVPAVSEKLKFGENDVVLGLQPGLQKFKLNGGKGYGQFESAGRDFAAHLDDALKQAENIRFSLDDVELSQVSPRSKLLNEFKEPAHGYTNYELHEIVTNPEFLKKTVFYRDGKVVSTESVLNELKQSGLSLPQIEELKVSPKSISPRVDPASGDVARMEMMNPGTAGSGKWDGKLPKVSKEKGAAVPAPEIPEIYKLVRNALADDMLFKKGQVKNTSSFGMQLDRRLTDEQMKALTREHGVEFALVYRTGPGKNGGGGTYWLYAGGENHVNIPIADDVIVLNHTHRLEELGGIASPSDYASMKKLADAGSPQRSSKILPVGSDGSVRFRPDERVDYNPAIKPSNYETLTAQLKARDTLKNNGVIGFGYDANTQELILLSEIPSDSAGVSQLYPKGMIYGNFNREGLVEGSLSHSPATTKAEIREAVRAIRLAVDPDAGKWVPASPARRNGISGLEQGGKDSNLVPSEKPKLYRGVPAKFDETQRLAELGIVVPRGSKMELPALYDHVTGRPVDAGVTSWTTDPEVAKMFAGKNGIVIEVEADQVADKVVARPQLGRFLNENEVLLKGPVYGKARSLNPAYKLGEEDAAKYAVENRFSMFKDYGAMEGVEKARQILAKNGAVEFIYNFETKQMAFSESGVSSKIGGGLEMPNKSTISGFINKNGIIEDAKKISGASDLQVQELKLAVNKALKLSEGSGSGEANPFWNNRGTLGAMDKTREGGNPASGDGIARMEQSLSNPSEKAGEEKSSSAARQKVALEANPGPNAALKMFRKLTGQYSTQGAEEAKRVVSHDGTVKFAYNADTKQLVLTTAEHRVAAKKLLDVPANNTTYQKNIIFGNANKYGVVDNTLAHSGATEQQIRDAITAVNKALEE